MSTKPVVLTRPRPLSIKRHLKAKGKLPLFANLSQFVSHIRDTSARWQGNDWKDREGDVRDVLNDVRIIGQVWFRGQRNELDGLRPGLYRPATWKHLKKNNGSPQPANAEDTLITEILDLEHELRIDFKSFGHLLNDAEHAKTPIDWYFLMQHQGVPTRLLDWTTNALAALFFAAEDYRKELESSASTLGTKLKPVISVWMMDSYWLADKLSDVWYSPLLPWSEDAERYVPRLESLLEKREDSYALIPQHAMPIEPPAMHPRVAAQEGRFVMFGRTLDLFEEELALGPLWDGSGTEELRLEQIRLKVTDVDELMQELAQLGVSRRTLFPDLAGLADFIKWKHFHKVRGYKL
jgi:hypothetical protein